MRISFKNTAEYKAFKDKLFECYNASKKVRISLTSKIKKLYSSNPDLKDPRIQNIINTSNNTFQCVRRSRAIKGLSITGVSKLFEYTRKYKNSREKNEAFVKAFLKEYSENISKLYAKRTTIKQRKKSLLIILKLYELLNLNVPASTLNALNEITGAIHA